MPNRIRRVILEFYNEISRDENHRYKSWEHCFKYFKQHRPFATEQEKDLAALHLSFYLASWGMYRGSSPLLWKDYKVHKPAINVLLKRRYERLWDPQFRAQSEEQHNIPLILELKNELSGSYPDHVTRGDGEDIQFAPTETLITKILLGTMACTPACDNFFIKGFRLTGLPFSEFRQEFLDKVRVFYHNHEEEFRQAKDHIYRESRIRYPVMKLVDMYFWKIGRDAG